MARPAGALPIKLALLQWDHGAGSHLGTTSQDGVGGSALLIMKTASLTSLVGARSLSPVNQFYSCFLNWPPGKTRVKIVPAILQLRKLNSREVK